MIRLRPHHLICIHKFIGKGYNEEFTQHMTDIVKLLKNMPETVIEIVLCEDAICEKCPNNIGKCKFDKKIEKMDRAVIKICGFTENTHALWQDLSQFVKWNILENDNFNNICSKCDWFNLCNKI